MRRHCRYDGDVFCAGRRSPPNTRSHIYVHTHTHTHSLSLSLSRQLSTLSTGLSTTLCLAVRERRCAAPILRRICPQFVAERKLIHFSTDLSTIRMHYAPFYAYETAVARHRNAGCRTTKPAVLRKTAQKSGKQTAEKLLRAFCCKGLCKRNRRFMQYFPVCRNSADREAGVLPQRRYAKAFGRAAFL